MMMIILSSLFMIPMFLFNCWWLVGVFLLCLFFFILHSSWMLTFFSSLSYMLGYDLVSLCLIMLSFWIIILMILASGVINILNNFKVEFMLVISFLLLFLTLSFSTSSLFLFYFIFEASLIPTLFLIYGWGYQPERLSAGFYLLFYTLFASLPLLICIFYIYNMSYTGFYFLIDVDCNLYMYISLILAFMVKMPMIFTHFWLPKAHVEAPISGSMILAGVLLKLGGYGLFRCFLFIYVYGVYLNYIWLGLSLYGMLIVGVLCLSQVDMKSLIAYSSVCHMGLVLCGILTLNYWGLIGSLILMIGHGICSSGLFCLANINYERTMSRSFFVNKGMLTLMPSLSMFWFILCSNNIASPPSLNLLGEIFLINSVMSWSTLTFLFLAVSSFFSCCYSIYLYSYIQHGFVYSGFKSMSLCNLREYFLVFFHILPLNLLVLKFDIVSLWL
uniref:NADH-ubiquinone oxidoreductase chain 4 n=1 Tax=Carcinocoris binghami TaxID=1347739 RepID=A0A342CF94_9HEMI|nr:NADH dehydrogenase subunit 4 [Carcinocoris binghami]AGO28047.1 NADH dehydrogenase subunit 4 [Carcinocoris binghami]